MTCKMFIQSWIVIHISLQLDKLHSPANIYLFYANKMAPDVSEGVLRPEHEYGGRGF